jgi:vitamin B12 transporter
MVWLFLLFSISAFADTAELDQIEVEAEKDIGRFTFVSSHVIPAFELENTPVGLVNPALEKVPGLIVSQNGGPGGRVSFFMRGTESRHVSFTLDGLKINDTSNTDRQFDAAFMSSPFIKDITVHKGPQSVLYGSDALAGMIEMKSRKGENAPETRFALNAGSFTTIDSSLSSDWKNKNNNGTLTASRFHTDGFSRINEKRYNADEKDATDITQLTSSSEHRWAPKVQTDLLASYLHGKAEQDGFASDNNNDISRNDQYILQQKTNLEINDSQAISLRNGFNRHQRHNESLTSGSDFFNGDLLQNEIVHRMEAGKVGILSGVATEHEAAKAIDMDRSFDLHSLFLQSSFREEKLKFHAGARAEKHSKYGSFYTGSAGVAYGGLSLQYSQGYKAPSLYQLYGPDSSGSPVGNPDLDPETSHSMEASWKTISDIHETGITLFQNRLANQFTYVFGQGYFNQQRFISEGIELFGKIGIPQAILNASFTHQQFKEKEASILRRPYNSAQVGFSYFPEETIETNVTTRWFSSRRDFGSRKLNGYEVVDLSIRKAWEKDDVALTFKNIFDRVYEDLYGFSVMPRSLFAHYGHKF